MPTPGWRAGSRLPSLHLVVLIQLAFARPIFGLLQANDALLAAHQPRSGDLLLFTVILAFVLPVLPVLVVAGLARWTPRAATVAHLLLLGGSIATIALAIMGRSAALPAVARVAVAIACGSIIAWLYARRAGFRWLLTLLSPAILVLPSVFLLASEIRSYAWPPSLVDARARAVQRNAPIVMVVFDALPQQVLLQPDGTIDADRFPSFAALAARSRWFRRATTVSDSTTYALPALLTGHYPDGSRPPTAHAYPVNLFSMLAGHRRLAVFETSTDLCPPTLCRSDAATDRGKASRWPVRRLLGDAPAWFAHSMFLGSRPSDRLASRNQRPVDRTPTTADPVTRFARFMETVEPGSDQTLYFLHVALPDTPWRYLPSGKTYDCGVRRIEGLDRGHWHDDDWLRLQGLQRFVLQMRYADRMLGRLLAVMEANGLDRRAMLIVTANRGASFVAGQHRRRISRGNQRSIATVPLFVKRPGAEPPVVDDRPVETIDVLPTLVAALGVTPPTSWVPDGRPLFDPNVPTRTSLTVFRGGRRLGQRLTFDPDLLHRANDGTAALLRRLAPGDRGSTHPRARSALLGRPLRQLRPRLDATRRVRLAPSVRSVHYDPAASEVPACAFGVVLEAEPDDGPFEIAVAVNGRVRAITRTFHGHRDRLAFHAVLPERAFRAGSNTIRAHVLRAPAAGNDESVSRGLRR